MINPSQAAPASLFSSSLRPLSVTGCQSSPTLHHLPVSGDFTRYVVRGLPLKSEVCQSLSQPSAQESTRNRSRFNSFFDNSSLVLIEYRPLSIFKFVKSHSGTKAYVALEGKHSEVELGSIYRSPRDNQTINRDINCHSPAYTRVRSDAALPVSYYPGSYGNFNECFGYSSSDCGSIGLWPRLCQYEGSQPRFLQLNTTPFPASYPDFRVRFGDLVAPFFLRSRTSTAMSQVNAPGFRSVIADLVDAEALSAPSFITRKTLANTIYTVFSRLGASPTPSTLTRYEP